MVRPEISALDRLRNKFWIRALLSRARAMEASAQKPGRLSWSDLTRRLLEQSPDATRLLPRGHRVQGVTAVVEEGADPHGFMLRIPADEVSVELAPHDKVVTRRRSGRAEPDSSQEKLAYVELKIDLVECGENLIPGSSAWAEGGIWELAQPFLPHLDELRYNMQLLKDRLGLASPSPEETAPYLSADELLRREHATIDQRRQSYSKALDDLTHPLNGYTLSFLAALTADSFMVGNAELSGIHVAAFAKAAEHVLEAPEFADVSQEFRELVVNKIVGQAWQFPASYHEPSIDAPLIDLSRWLLLRKKHAEAWITSR